MAAFAVGEAGDAKCSLIVMASLATLSTLGDGMLGRQWRGDLTPPRSNVRDLVAFHTIKTLTFMLIMLKACSERLTRN
jgi:hypothetical protein